MRTSALRHLPGRLDQFWRTHPKLQSQLKLVYQSPVGAEEPLGNAMTVTENVGKRARITSSIAFSFGAMLPVIVPVAAMLVAYYPVGSPLLLLGYAPTHSIETGIALSLAALSLGILIVGVGWAAVRGAWRPLKLAISYLAGVLVGIVPGVLLASVTRDLAFYLLTPRTAALVQAIEGYEAQHGAPPHQLSELVPSLLHAIPGTGMLISPGYEYAPGPGPCPAGNSWHLRISLDKGDYSRALLFYCPRHPHDLEPVERDFQYTTFESKGDWVYSSTDLDD